MDEATGAIEERREHHGNGKVSEARRDDIVRAARDLFEEKGMAKTSIKDITDRVGVTRGLFYYYFPDKDAVTAAVLDDFVEDFTQMVHIWNEGRVRGDVRGSLESCVKMLRRGLFDNDRFRIDLVSNENASLYLQFSRRVSQTLARYITDTTAVDYARYHTIEIDHVYETFYLLICGIIGFLRSNPDASDEVIQDLIAQTLRLDLGDGTTTASSTGAPQALEGSRG